MTLVVYRANDNLLEVVSLQDQSADAYVNNATVTAAIKTLAGVAVTGLESLTLDYVPASDGLYRVQIPATAPLKIGKYAAEITVVGGAGQKAFWTITFQVEERTA